MMFWEEGKFRMDDPISKKYLRVSEFASTRFVIGILMKQIQNTGSDPTGWKFRQLVGPVVDD